jgi:hypothetical protein
MRVPVIVEGTAAREELSEAAALAAVIEDGEARRVEAALDRDLAGLHVNLGLREALADALRVGTRGTLQSYVNAVSELYREHEAREGKNTPEGEQEGTR